MATARDRFIESLVVYRHASQQGALLGASPSATLTDHSARVLRNGLAVIGLVILEEFIRTRVAELATYVGRASLPMTSFPADLRKAATERAVRNLASEVQNLVRAKQDPTPLIVATAQALSTARSSRVKLAELSLMWAGSNVRMDDIAAILAALGVDKPWVQLTSVAQRSGFRIAAMETTFGTLLTDRHEAAHKMSKEVINLDIRSYPNSALAFAIAFDAVASRAAAITISGSLAPPSKREVTAADVRLRFVDDTGAGYAEHVEGSSARIALNTRMRVARAAAVRAAAVADETVVVRDRNLLPTWWRAGNLA